jgi:hypothetical protein
MTYVKKPVEVEAFRLGKDIMPDWFREKVVDETVVLTQGVIGDWWVDNDIVEADIITLEGVMHANNGDWIIKGLKDEMYPCKHDIFIETYERESHERD